MFDPVNSKQSFPELEEKILKFWEENEIFKKTLEQREKGRPKSVFFDGPPFANGMPHYGHVLQSVLKDAMSRYKTMRGYYVPRVAGWDTHGLPVENEVEKQNNIKTKKDIEEIGIKKFTEDCRSSVFKYQHEFEKIFKRIGRWVDVENGYATLNLDYMESIWWVFKQIWDKGLVYEGYKPMHISTALETPLSNFEVSQNYKDITDYTVTAKFKVIGEDNLFMLAWTTTPWTLPGNQALAVNPELKYVKVLYDGEWLILAQDLMDALFGEEKKPEAVEPINIEDYLGKKYEPLFDYFKNLDDKNFRILKADFVNTESGTGIVHIAGGFGEDDFKVVNENGLNPIVHVKMNGNFTDEVEDFAGKYVKGQDQNIGKYLEEKGLLFSHSNYRHSYPHCWRTDTPLLNYVTSSWFIKVTDVKEKMLANNEKINWQPKYIKHGRFGKWLEGARDWSISRNRYWGCPLPIWRNDNGDVICIGSLEELKELTGGILPKREGEVDLHKPQIDEITFMHPYHKENNDERYLMKRVNDVFDCWFESGAMPYAQLHYPFDNKDLFEENFPADFIIEAVDQTRGWFYTLHVLATILFDEPAFKNVISTGLILAEDGEKLSKRKKNFVEPNVLFANQGVDAMRFYIFSSPLGLGDNVRFSDKIVGDFLKKFTLTIWNTYSFFVTYANIDNFEPKSEFMPENELDKWILIELNTLIDNMTLELEDYNIMKATRPMIDFVDNLSNWYVRRSRRRFWKSENDNDKSQAYQTLYLVLTEFAKMLAPFMPFLAEEIYKNLTKKESVHLESWPAVNSELNANANEKAQKILSVNRLVRDIVTLGHAVRDKAEIKVRQPLLSAKVAVENLDDVKKYESIIKDELNVKELEFIKDAEGIVKPIIKPNARILGPIYGRDVQKIISAAREGSFEIKKDGKVNIAGFVLEEGQYEPGYECEEGISAESKGGLTVILDTEVTADLKNEGYVRDIVRFIQELRKEADYKVSDRIIVNILADKEIDEAVTQFADYIMKETLANEVQQSGDLEWDKEKELEIEGKKVKIAIKKQV
ncbi:isoleucine--tRNA ligase [Candidatus Peregrinibacteria bacterium]|nr:isoleucine--tRNA ligase [Candidatus Peregrinibacteria bacterium]